jgi:guanylate kinase
MSDAAFDARLAAAGTVPLLAVLSGPSGVGKDTLVHRLAELGQDFDRVVTYTTREPRAGETHGVDYWFIDQAEYDRLLRNDALIEHAMVYGDYCYGVPREPVEAGLAAGRDVVLRIDVQGALTIRQRVPSSVLVFLAAPSLAAQEERLRERGTDDEASIIRRLERAREEMTKIDAFDYLLISPDDRPERAAADFRAILIAERWRVRAGNALDEVRAVSLASALP